MKIRLTFKGPDHYAETSNGEICRWTDLAYKQAREELLTYDEYLTIEYDTETKESRVISPKE